MPEINYREMLADSNWSARRCDFEPWLPVVGGVERSRRGEGVADTGDDINQCNCLFLKDNNRVRGDCGGYARLWLNLKLY